MWRANSTVLYGENNRLLGFSFCFFSALGRVILVVSITSFIVEPYWHVKAEL